MVSGESCNEVNYKVRSIGAETRLGSEGHSIGRYTIEGIEFNPTTSSLQRFFRRVSAQIILNQQPAQTAGLAAYLGWYQLSK